MNTSLEKIDDASSKLIVKIAKTDYEENVTNGLKKVQKTVQMPGFRKGKVPMSLVQKMYGEKVKADEVEKLFTNAVNDYIKDNKIELLADPMMSEDQKMLDISKDDDFEFHFDLALAPQFEMELTDKDKVTYYNIEIDDDTLNKTIDSYRSRNGKYVDGETYEPKDLVKGSLVEMSGKCAKRGGLKLEEVSVMPEFFVNDEEKKKFEGATKGSNVIFNVSKAYEGREGEIATLLKIEKEDVAKYTGDFKLKIEKISRYTLGEVNQELFDMVYGKDTIKSADEFTAKVKADLTAQYEKDSDYKFLIDLKETTLKKAGKQPLPEALLKKSLLQGAKTDGDKETIEKYFDEYLKDCMWSLIRNKLTKQFNVTASQEALEEAAKEMAQMQFAQYGMSYVPDDILTNYAKEMLNQKDKMNNIISYAIDHAITKGAKEVVKMTKKKISIADFNKMFEDKKA